MGNIFNTFNHSFIRVGCIDQRAETLQYVKNKEFENLAGTETQTGS